MEITKSVKYIGVNDKKLDLFEGQYSVPNGMAYNSYVILDEKIAVLDTVEAHFGDEWLKNLELALNGQSPDFLIVQHMEPDHSANITTFMDKYPSATIVSSDKAFLMMKQFFGVSYEDRRTVIKDGDVLSLGGRELKFFAAPMVHWPEVVLTYDPLDKIIFSADAFGKFGALDTDEDWACEARRYYFGIVGKYGAQVQRVLPRLSSLDISFICPLHGPVLSDNLGYYIDLYNTWSSYKPESEGVFIAYTSVYGNTKKAVELLERELTSKGCAKVVVSDLARSDMAEAVEDAFRYGKIVLATTTYNADIFPFMREFIHELCERGYKDRLIGIIENGSWAPTAAKKIKEMLAGCKGLEFTESAVSIRSAMSEDNKKQISDLAAELCK